MAKNIEDGDVDNGLELSQELVSNHGTKYGSEVAKHGEGVVDDRGLVLSEVQLLLQVDGKDGLHTIVGKSLTEFIANNEEHALRVGHMLEHKMIVDELLVLQWSALINTFQ